MEDAGEEQVEAVEKHGPEPQVKPQAEEPALSGAPEQAETMSEPQTPSTDKDLPSRTEYSPGDDSHGLAIGTAAGAAATAAAGSAALAHNLSFASRMRADKGKTVRLVSDDEDNYNHYTYRPPIPSRTTSRSATSGTGEQSFREAVEPPTTEAAAEPVPESAPKQFVPPPWPSRDLMSRSLRRDKISTESAFERARSDFIRARSQDKRRVYQSNLGSFWQANRGRFT